MGLDPPDGRNVSWLPRISVSRPVTVLMILCALLLLGAVALFKLPVQLMPSGYDPSFMMVRIPYAAANPTEVAETLVRPLEDALYTVRGLRELSCRASNDHARCWMEFESYVDMDETYDAVSDRVERLRATVWPDDVDRVNIRRYNPQNDPTLSLGIGLPPGLDDPYWVLQHRVAQRLERVPGVASVELEGVDEKQIFIEPDREALAAHRVSPRDLVRALSGANFALASGDLRDGERKLLLRSVARFSSQEEIARLPLRPDGLRLGDVARVRHAAPERDRASRLDGAEAAIVEVFKESEANTISVTRAVRDAIDDLARDEPLLAGGDFDVLMDQGETIANSIRQLRDTGLVGALLAVVILYLFLRRARVTLLITLSIPASLLACLVVLYFAGASINLVTMMGLIICTGMLVDNAVVVVENIDRHRQEQRSVRDAALHGASEVALALTMATVTTVAVFLPMALMTGTGQMRFMLGTLALPVVVSILASLVVAMLFVPLAASRLLRARPAQGGERRRGRWVAALYARTIEPGHRRYLALLDWTLAHRGAALSIVALTVVATLWPWQQVEFQLQQGRSRQGGRQAGFFFNLPNSYGMEQADAWFRKIEGLFDQLRPELGIRHVQTRFWSNRGLVRVMLDERADIRLEDAIERLRAVVPETPGVQTFVNWQRGGGSDASLTVSLYGEDTPTLAGLAEEAERRLRRLPQLVSVEPDLESALEELRVRVDRGLAQRYGVAPEVVTGTVASALRGQQLPRFRSGEKEIEMRVRYSEADRRGIGQLASLELRADSGRRIPLEALAELTIRRGYGEIERRDRQTILNIKLNATRGELRQLEGQVREVMDGMALPRGYRWDFGSAGRWERQESGNLGLGLGLSVLFIYLIMGFLFESALLHLP